MRRVLLTLIACCLCAIASLQKAAAINFKGGEIRYQWLADSTYRFYLKLYGPCTGLPATPPNTTSLCYYNTCNSVKGSVTLHQLFTPPTPQPQAPAYTEYWYMGMFTLPSRCDSWTFYASIDNRDSSVNLNNALSNIYLEATINNLAAQDASSTIFMAEPAPYAYIGHPYYYQFALQDPNSDIYEMEMVQPRTAGANFTNPGNCAGGYPASDINYKNANLNIANPLQCQNSFTYNMVGSFSFTPDTTALGANAIAVRVKKYRNGVKIGTVTREVMINVIPMPNDPQPFIELDTNTITGATIDNFGIIQATTYTNFSFCYTVSKGNVELTLRDNSATKMPGSTAVYIGQGTSQAQVCYNWTPTWTDTGLKVINLAIADTTLVDCNAIKPQLTDQHLIQIPVHVSAPAGITPVCYSDLVTIHPNPATTAVTITYAGKPVNVTICSLDGKMILQKQNTNTVDISSLSKGIYLMRISNENGQLLKVEKLIKL